MSVFATLTTDGSLLVEPAGALKGKVSVTYSLNGKIYRTRLDLRNTEIPLNNVAVRQSFLKGFEANRNQIVAVKR